MANLKKLAPLWKASRSDTPLGTLTCGMTQRGLAYLVFGYGQVCEGQLLEAASPATEQVEHNLQAALDQVSAYLEGCLQIFTIPLDLSECRDFQKRVLHEVTKIPYGQVVTYGQIAKKVGGLKYSHAVGRALGGNPIPLVIPCHRVISSGGRLGGYSGWGGARTKAWLLKLEGQLLVAE